MSRIFLAGAPDQSSPDLTILFGVTTAPAATMASLSTMAPVQDRRLHADEGAVMDLATVDHRQMADQHIVADEGVELAAGHVDDAAVLDVRALADAHEADIGPDDNIVPEA